ncbi:MAG TPA: hypothetical protein VKZ60_19985 [Chloroflexota bacterium]|nr:hypothetical protein [Chloroflexota bacterium]
MRPYHVELGGQGYLVDLASYRKEAGEQFAPKQAVSTRYYADLKDVGAWAQVDWQGGRGATRWQEVEAARFAAGAGLDTLRAGEVRCGPRAVPVAAWAPQPPTRQVVGFVTYRGGLFWATVAGGTLALWRAESEAGLPARWTVADGAVGGLASWGNAVWVGSGTGGQVYRWEAGSGTFGPGFAVPDAQGVPVLAGYVLEGTASRLYLGVRREAGGQVYAWDGTAATLLLTLEGAEPTHLFGFDGRLYVAAADAGGQGRLYRYDGTAWTLVAQLAENWAQCGAAFGGYYWLGSGRDNRVWRFDGRALVETFAGLAPSGARIGGMAAAQGRLYVGAAAEAGARSLLASATGMDWHDLGPQGLVPAEANGLGVCGIGALNGAVYLAEELSAGTGAGVYRLALGSAWNTAGELVTARFDAGLPSVDKAWRRCTVTHAPLASGEGVEVAYRLDGATAWQLLVMGAVPGSVRSVGMFAPGVAGREIELRLRLTSGGISTPRVKSVLVEYGLVPDVRRVWEFAVLLEGTPGAPLRRLDGAPEPRTGAELSAALWEARAVKGTVPFRDLDGVEYQVYFAGLREAVAPLPQRGGWQTRAVVRLVEA